jgi:hypothetical protein
VPRAEPFQASCVVSTCCPPSRPGTSPESVTCRSGLASRQVRCSRGVPPLQGLAPTGSGPAVASVPPLLGFVRISLAVAANSDDLAEVPALQSLTRTGGGRTGSRRDIYPLEVSNLVATLMGSKTAPHLAYGLTSDPGARRRVLRILFGAVESPAGAP